MKKLEELGISPAPWSAEANDDDQLIVYDAEGHEICQCFTGENDACVMKSAPEMYKCLRELYYWSERLFDTGNDDSDFAMAIAKVSDWRKKTRTVLAGANGVKS